ncbi:uncharacterized protein LOC120690988 isoform X2 [Panicum virgatum]|uniref:uncharacterized protein LOC120690988 isoform X2 n=1 Tax=Panicum virgatum TaxID=38727 RepID=UPI0019D67A5D|nr:uncharacterized protein LOC120690988 isoform X2 [Panicum virgatum]
MAMHSGADPALGKDTVDNEYQPPLNFTIGMGVTFRDESNDVGTSSDRVVMEFLLRFKMIETQRGHRLSQKQYNCSSKKEFLLMSMVLFVAVHNHYKRIYKPIRRLAARPRRCRRLRVLRRARASTRRRSTCSRGWAGRCGRRHAPRSRIFYQLLSQSCLTTRPSGTSVSFQ